MKHRFFLKLLVMTGLLGGGKSVSGQELKTGVRPYPPVQRRPPVRRSRNDATRPPLLAAPVAGALGPAFCPLVELRALNKAYVRELAYRRGLRAARPADQSPVRFDSLLLPGTVLHNQRLVNANGGLFHDHQHPHNELIGYASSMMRHREQPAQLAHVIWQAFDDSKKGHKEVQQDHRFAHVSVSCSDTYFVVRLDYQPSTTTKAEQKDYARWQQQRVRVP